MQYQIDPSVPLGDIFRNLENARTSNVGGVESESDSAVSKDNDQKELLACLLEDYSVTQTTLDQVFINFAKQQGDVSAPELPRHSHQHSFSGKNSNGKGP